MRSSRIEKTTTLCICSVLMAIVACAVAFAAEWQPSGTSQLTVVAAHAGPVCGLVYSRDESLLVSVASDGCLKAFRKDNAQFREVLSKQFEFRIMLTQPSVKGDWLDILGDDGRIYRAVVVVDSRKQTLLNSNSLPINIPEIRHFCTSDNGAFVAVISGNWLTLHDGKDGRQLWRIRTGVGYAGGFVVFDPTAENLLVNALGDRVVAIINARDGTHTESLVDRGKVANGYMWGRFSPDKKSLAMGSRTGNVQIWDWESRQLVNEYNLYNDARSWTCCCFSYDSTAVFTAKSQSNFIYPSELTIVKLTDMSVLRLANSKRPVLVGRVDNSASALCLGETSDVVYFGTNSGTVWQLSR